jgi:hypothetical protein
MCIGCHRDPGIYGVMSLQRFKPHSEDPNDPRPLHPVATMTIQTVEQNAIQWKEAQTGRLALQKLWPK